MINKDEALKIILNNTKILNSIIIDTKFSYNFTIAENIYAHFDLPPFHNSAMDGYAVIVDDLKNISKKCPVILEVIDYIPAGKTSKKILKSRQAMKIMTGAHIPKGANGVVMIENTKEFNISNKKYVQIYKKIKKWENIRFKGEDVKKGSLVIPQGKIIRPQEIAMLAALNKKKIKVIKRPYVGILNTGSELLEIGKRILPGKIYNINGHSLFSQILKYGGNPVDFGIVKDIKREIQKKLNIIFRYKPKLDVLIISGGVSIGDCDFVKELLIKNGLILKFHKVAIKPGMPLLFGVLNDILIFGLPGNPAASQVTFECFVAPAILKMQGKEKMRAPTIEAIAIKEIVKPKGRTHFIYAMTRRKNGFFLTKPSGEQSSGMIKPLVDGNSLIIFPKELNKINKGEKVKVQLLDILDTVKLYDTNCFSCWRIK